MFYEEESIKIKVLNYEIKKKKNWNLWW
jgi:hypothetical protein